MLLIQDTTENVGQSKPLRVTGPQMQVDVSWAICVITEPLITLLRCLLATKFCVICVRLPLILYEPTRSILFAIAVPIRKLFDS